MYWLRSAWLSMKGQLRYRSNLLISMGAQVLGSIGAIAGIAMLFARFKSLAGYRAEEVFLLFGITLAAFALAELLARGFDWFDSLLSDGGFDRVLLRPRNVMGQVLASRFDYSRIGRFAIGIGVLLWAAPRAVRGWTFLKALTIAFMVAGGAAIFTGVFILGAAMAFLTTDALEFVNILSDGGRELSQYPHSIYGKWLRRFFTFIVPFACVNYLPLSFVLGREGADPRVCLLPLAGFAFIAPAIAVWRFGVGRYRSTGS